ncbi:MAG: cation diffusion facilitator family transporter [Thermoanaerobaculia bacterium]|nr:cation diffusion facilitator family transporter [Thermoanaerobaculia bacterium]
METSQEPRWDGIRRTLTVALILNLLVAAAKLVVGFLSGSIALVADGLHSVTDGAANVVGLVSVAAAGRPADSGHPYGHGRFETLSALAIGGLLTLTAWEVLTSCLKRVLSDNQPEAPVAGFVVLAVTIVINLSLSKWERRQAKLWHSPLLLADSTHTASDVWVSLAVFGSLVGTRLGFPAFDWMVGFLITFAIGRAAFQILRDNAQFLADAAWVDPNEIRRVALETPGVLAVHKVRSRGGSRHGHADLHAQMKADLPLEAAHRIGHQVVDRLRDEFGLDDVVVHVEPYSGSAAD